MSDSPVNDMLQRLLTDEAPTRATWLRWLRKVTGGSIPRPDATLRLEFARRTAYVYDLRPWDRGVAAVMDSDEVEHLVIFHDETLSDMLHQLARELDQAHDAALHDEGLTVKDHRHWGEARR